MHSKKQNMKSNVEYAVEKLEMYQLAMAFGESVWGFVADWSFFQKDTIGKQLVRSTDSIAANMAEGYERHYFKDMRFYFYISRSSLCEARTWMRKAHARKFITDDQFEMLESSAVVIHNKINGYLAYLNRQSEKS